MFILYTYYNKLSILARLGFEPTALARARLSHPRPPGSEA